MKSLLSFCIAGLAFAFTPGIVQAQKILLVAGGGTNEVNGGPATQAKLKEPFGVDFDAAGNMFIIEMNRGNRLLKLDSRGMLSHVGGEGTVGDSGDGGPPLKARFNGPHNLAVLPNSGDILIADTWNGRIRRVDSKANTISPVSGFSVPPAQAKSFGPYCITPDFSGTKLYVADLRRVHVINLKTGTAKVVAGNGQKGKPQDGALAVESPLTDPRAVAPDRKGNVYLLERGGHALRVVGADGKIRTVVNVSGEKGMSGDGGAAVAAKMNGPKHLCVDLQDNVIIADAENHVIRKYLPATGQIVLVAGTGKKGSAGLGGPPEKAELNRPHGVTVHKDGTLYVADSENNRILKVVP
jgi:hypothetical protein